MVLPLWQAKYLIPPHLGFSCQIASIYQKPSSILSVAIAALENGSSFTKCIPVMFKINKHGRGQGSVNKEIAL